MDAPLATGRSTTPRRVAGTGAAVLALALIAALLLVAAELSTVATVDVANESCEVINDSSPDLADRCELSGWERHGGALILLALAGAGAAVAVRRGAAEAGGAVLAVVGAVVLGLALIGDLPETNQTGAIGLSFDGATASAGLGFYLELTGGALFLIAALLALLPTRLASSSAAR
jgi:hypothetical protein